MNSGSSFVPLEHNELIHKFPDFKKIPYSLLPSFLRFQLDRKEDHRTVEHKELQRNSGLAGES